MHARSLAVLEKTSGSDGYDAAFAYFSMSRALRAKEDLTGALQNIVSVHG